MHGVPRFWIDVGGTFTDCFLQPAAGPLQRHKLLSSGVTKGQVGVASTASCLIDAARTADPSDFWRGATLRLLDAAGQVIGESRVERFEQQSGKLWLAAPLPFAGQPFYELATGDEAPIVAIRYLLKLPPDQPIPPTSVRLGTTRGTNALLTRQGARTALLTTRGFADVLRIGYQNRPKLFELPVRKPEPLFAAAVEIDERIAASGDVLLPINERQSRQVLASLREQNIVALAICLLHATTNSRHERQLSIWAREAGFAEISISSQVAPIAKIVSRGDTTVVDAYLTPVLRSYVAALRAKLPGSELQIMTSAGGLVAGEQFHGKDSILSGPAGGAVGFGRISQAAGFSRAIGFDMGGTSTDVSRFDGRHPLEYETEKAGVRVVAPMIAIETVAAGGGSICRFDGAKLTVGPASAGADPGPACYGRGGPLTVTDCNFFLGRIPPLHFPFPLLRAPVERLLKDVCEGIQAATGQTCTPPQMADGLLRIANSAMVQAIRAISVAQGCDPRDYLLTPFGGAAGQHACAVASELGISQILCHPDAGLLSAYGIGLADHSQHRTLSLHRNLDSALVSQLETLFQELELEPRGVLLQAGVPNEWIEIHRALELRYRGQESTLTIEYRAPGAVTEQFEIEHQRRYGYHHPQRQLEVVSARVETVGRSAERLPASRPSEVSRTIIASRHTPACLNGYSVDVPLLEADELRPGDRIAGPAILAQRTSTTVIDAGWQGEVLSGGELLLTRVAAHADDAGNSTASQHSAELSVVDPILLEIFNHHFAAIAQQMGITLRNTASSVNVKERLDFSCAIFTARGELVANAPHVPVHLGAMGETVRNILREHPGLRPGDVMVSNDPYRGGSHLPDVTVVTPVFDASAGLTFFTASRAHHAEIGGITPGSMPPFSTNLAQEGVLIRNFKLIDAGDPRYEQLRELLLTAPYPTRAVGDNLADLSAQLAANRQGATQLQALVERYSRPVVLAYMRHIQTAAEQQTRRAIRQLPPGVSRFVDHLDDGTPIAVELTVTVDQLTIDFCGSGDVLPGNLNANTAIVRAAVMYVLRCLIADDLPLNEGVLAPVTLLVPPGLLNPPANDDPRRCAAIVGGNVETSQRVVDVLLGALGISAASQGTMNNLLFGDSTFGYYETICGGNGATATGPGADAVHCHMTNTRLTDVEVLERRFPVRVLEFSIRRDSGGHGQHRGGHGVVRRLEFLKPLTVSILSQRRGRYLPYGSRGGLPGAAGRNVLIRAGQTSETLPAQIQFLVAAGDVLTIETPGGGGWGSPTAAH